jgi:hypothetical protein
MTGFPHSRTTVRCPAVATVSAAALSTLTAATVDLRRERGPFGCELGAGHDGTHVALAATARGGDQWWWLRWHEQFSEVIQIDPCTTELMHGPDSDCCILPEDHTGPHSFDLPPLSCTPSQATPRPRSGQRSSGGSAGRGRLTWLHKPDDWLCACLPDCWCKQTKVGYALRWYTPGRWHRLPDPSSCTGLRRCR